MVKFYCSIFILSISCHDKVKKRVKPLAMDSTASNNASTIDKVSTINNTNVQDHGKNEESNSSENPPPSKKSKKDNSVNDMQETSSSRQFPSN